MKPVGDHGLTCLDGADYSAIALNLQGNAKTDDSVLTQIQSTLEGYNDYPWFSLISTSSDTFAQFTSEWTGSGSFPGSHFINTYTITSFGLGNPTFPQITPAVPAGWWYLGGTCTFQATGAITANSRRDLAIEWDSQPSGILTHEYSVSSVWESNTGGDSLTTVGMFYANGENTFFPDLVFNHKNAASTMTVNSGARLWGFYMGTGVTV